MNDKAGNSESIEIALGNVLRWGTIISAVVIAIGGAGYLLSAGGQTPQYGTFHGEPSDLSSVAGIIEHAGAFHWRGVIQFGLLLLVGTPIARVVGALVGFAVRRDPKYVVISSLVLAALLYSLLAS